MNCVNLYENTNLQKQLQNYQMRIILNYEHIQGFFNAYMFFIDLVTISQILTVEYVIKCGLLILPNQKLSKKFFFLYTKNFWLI